MAAEIHRVHREKLGFEVQVERLLEQPQVSAKLPFRTSQPQASVLPFRAMQASQALALRLLMHVFWLEASNRRRDRCLGTNLPDLCLLRRLDHQASSERPNCSGQNHLASPVAQRCSRGRLRGQASLAEEARSNDRLQGQASLAEEPRSSGPQQASQARSGHEDRNLESMELTSRRARNHQEWRVVC